MNELINTELILKYNSYFEFVTSDFQGPPLTFH